MSRDPRLDALRASAMVVVIAAHTAMGYMVTSIGWAIQDDGAHLGFDLGVWFMRVVIPVFFWLSGYFSRALYERGALLRHRVTRVLVPLVVLVVPIALVLQEMWAWGRVLQGKPAVASNVPRVDGEDWSITLAHLWFLYYLLAASAVTWVAVVVARRWRIPPVAGVALVIALVVGPLLRVGTVALVTPIGFIPDLDVLAFHLGFFAWGWIVHAHARELERYARYWWALVLAAALALAAIAPALLAIGDHGADDRAPVHAILGSAAFSLALAAAWIGACVRFGRPSPLVHLAAEASYPTYIAHLPIVVALQLVFSQVALPGVIEFVLIVAATLVACIAGYAAVSRFRRNRRANGDSSR
jgi:glucan biosynthesis protein C